MKTKISPKTSVSITFTIRDVHQDFMISREAIGVSKKTYQWYEFNLNKYYEWLENQELHSINDAANVKNINGFLAHLRNSKPVTKNGQEVKGRSTLSDRYIHAYARTIRTLLRFAYDEHYIPEPVKFKMPPIRKNKLPVLEVEDITKIFNAAQSTRDLVLVTLAIASGMRLSEIMALNWNEIDLRKGWIDVLQGKGMKYRTVIIDKDTLRLIIRYHNELKAIDEDLITSDSPLIQTDDHNRLTAMGIRSIFTRLAGKTGIHFSAHALRRTFARMAIKNGMDIVWLQTLMGHANLETTRDYVQGLDIEDVDRAYQDHAPLKGMIKNIKNKKS